MQKNKGEAVKSRAEHHPVQTLRTVGTLTFAPDTTRPQDQVTEHRLEDTAKCVEPLGVTSSRLTQWTNRVCEHAGFELVTLSLRAGRAGLGEEGFQETITLDLGR